MTPAYGRELIARMLEDYASYADCELGSFSPDSLREQARLLREADNAEAANIGTVSVSPAVAGDGTCNCTDGRCGTPPAPAAEQPQGEMVLVPREPTQAMVRAGTMGGLLTPNQACAAFQSMLSAAPSRPVVDEVWSDLARDLMREIDANAEPFVSHKDDLLISAKALMTAALAGKDGAK